MRGYGSPGTPLGGDSESDGVRGVHVLWCDCLVLLFRRYILSNCLVFSRSRLDRLQHGMCARGSLDHNFKLRFCLNWGECSNRCCNRDRDCWWRLCGHWWSYLRCVSNAEVRRGVKEAKCYLCGIETKAVAKAGFWKQLFGSSGWRGAVTNEAPNPIWIWGRCWRSQAQFFLCVLFRGWRLGFITPSALLELWYQLGCWLVGIPSYIGGSARWYHHCCPWWVHGQVVWRDSGRQVAAKVHPLELRDLGLLPRNQLSRITHFSADPHQGRLGQGKRNRRWTSFWNPWNMF